MAPIPKQLTYEGIPVWRHAKILRVTLQVVSGILVVALVIWFFANISNAVQERNIPYGYSFLDRSYLTPIGQHFLPYDASDSFRYALVVASTNTIFVSIIGVILATVVGIAVGVARISGNWLVSRIALTYVEFFRNVPLLVQLFFWFYILLALPQIQESYAFGERFYVNNAGIWAPGPSATDAGTTGAWLGIAAGGMLVGVVVHRLMTRREERTGAPSYPVLTGLAATVLIGAIGWLIVGAVSGEAPFVVSNPAPQGDFGRIQGGIGAPAALIALLAGLVIYTSAFIAEIVRAGIQSVRRGQVEAARALGLTPSNALRHVIFPQALRVIVPPTISQYLNLAKNSSLAAAIGYADLTNVAKTMTQTAPAVSIFILIMLIYLAISLTYSLIGNLYNQRIRFSQK